LHGVETVGDSRNGQSVARTTADQGNPKSRYAADFPKFLHAPLCWRQTADREPTAEAELDGDALPAFLADHDESPDADDEEPQTIAAE